MRRWFTVGSDTVQAGSMSEAQRIVKTMQAYKKRKAGKHGSKENNRKG